MTEVVIHHAVNAEEINRMLRAPNGGVAKDMLRRGKRVEAAAKGYCPVDHGRLRGSIHTQFITVDGVIGVEVGTDVEYAMWVHNGTGLYGPYRTRVVPKNARVMVFTPRTSAAPTPSGRILIPKRKRTTVFARSTRGMRGTPFLLRALPAAGR